MSYDFDEIPTREKRPKTIADRMRSRYWLFIVWCALDVKSERVNQWGLRRLEMLRQKTG